MLSDCLTDSEQASGARHVLTRAVKPVAIAQVELAVTHMSEAKALGDVLAGKGKVMPHGNWERRGQERPACAWPALHR